MPKPCPSEQELSGFVFGTLSENEADRVSAHLNECPPCEDTVQRIEQTADLVVAGLRQKDSPDPFLNESGCDRVIELVEAIGRDPSFTQLPKSTAAVPIPTPELGTIRSYRLLEKLGQGGMGSVYKALHVDLDKIVALKVLPKECTQDEGAIARFRREMKAVGKLNHTHIVQATDAGQEDGTHYLVMELVDGSDLSKLVARHGRLPIADACELIRQAAEGLEHAHKHGLVHRDIKPSNLMLTTYGTVKILDLGLALLGGVHHEGGGELTSTGQIMGTIDYMAPEQGSDTHNVDIRADVYSLGATLFKLLTGKAPFEAEQYKSPMKKLMALANTEPPRADALRPEVPRALADLVARMLSKTPSKRPTPPSEVAKLLAPFAKGANLPALLATIDPSSAPVPPPTEDKPAVGGSTAAATILVDTDVSGTLEAVPNTSPPREQGAGSEELQTKPSAQVGMPPTQARSASEAGTLARRASEGAGTQDSQTKPTASVGTTPTSEPSPPGRGQGEGSGQLSHAARLKQHWSHLRSRPRLLLALGGGLIALLMGVTIFKFVTRDGTIVIELPPGVDNVEVTVNGEIVEVEINGNTIEVSVDSGESHNLVVMAGGVELQTETNDFRVAAGDEEFVRFYFERRGSPAVTGESETQTASLQPAGSGNYALQFDGVDSLVELEGITDLSSPLTYEAWVRTDDVQRHGHVVWCGSPQWTALEIHDGRWTFAVMGSEQRITRQSDVYPVGGAFTHIASTWDGASMHLFVNGVETGETTSYSPISYNLQLACIGGAPDSPAHFFGVIDEVRISNTARYTENFTPEARFTDDEHTLALYHFDEGQGNVLVDSSGNGHHGTIHGATWVREVAPNTWAPQVPDFSNYALQFDGLDDAVNVALLQYDGSHPMTIEAWARPKAGVEHTGYVVYNSRLRLRLAGGATENQGYWLGEAELIDSSNVDGFPPGAAPSSFEGWTDRLVHLALVYDGAAVTLFVDGRAQSSIMGSGLRDIGPHPEHFMIGSSFAAPPDGRFGGVLDEVRISNTVRYTEDFTPQRRFEADADTLALYHFDEGQGPVLVDSSGNGHDGTIHGGIWVDSNSLELRQPAELNFLAEREVAEWVIAQGGTANCTSPDLSAQYSVSPGQSLPEEPFWVQSIGMPTPSSPADLAMLRHLYDLQGFYQQDIAMTDEGVAEILKVRSLWSLILNGSGVTDNGLRGIADACPHLEHVILQDTSVTDATLAELARLRLAQLQVHNSLISDAGLEHLAGVSTLSQLSLSGSPGITDRGIAHLATLGKLEFLNIHDTGITDECLETLRSLTALKSLDVTNTAITDAGLAALHGMETLVSLRIEGTNTTQQAVQELHEALPGCQIVSSFGVFEPLPTHNYALQFDGVDDWVQTPAVAGTNGVVTIEAWIRSSQSSSSKGEVIHSADSEGGIGLTIVQTENQAISGVLDATNTSRVAFTGTPIIPEQFTHLASVLDGSTLRLYVDGVMVAQTPTEAVRLQSPFAIGRNNLIPQDWYIGLIDEVHISNTVRYTENFTPAPRFEADEHTLALYHFDEGQGETLVDSSGNGHDGTIHGATWVREVAPGEWSPYDTEVERFVAEAVLRAGGKVCVVIPQVPVDAGQRQSFAYGTNLFHELPLLGPELTIESHDALPAEPFHIIRVQLRQQAVIDTALLESLARIPFLFELNLERSNVNDAQAAVIGRMSQLRNLNVATTALTDQGLRELSQLANLRYFAASDVPGITDEGLQHVSHLTNLVELYLHDNPQITDRGIASLRDLPHVGWLWLEGTGITDAALESLSGFEELDSLRLSDTRINGSGLTHLSRLQKLNWLFLHETDITDEFGVLLKDVQFGSLWLSGTSVGDETLQAIAGRPQIHQLTLNGTEITDAGLAHLQGTRIVHLSANNTALTGSGLADLDIVQVLDLSQTPLTDEAAQSLSRYTTLTTLNVADTPVSEETVQSLHEALTQCTIYSDFGTFEPLPAVTETSGNLALSFDGIQGSVMIPTLHCTPGEPMTVECYAWPRRVDGNGRLIMMRGEAMLGLIVGNGDVVANGFQAGSAHGLREPISLPIERPLHLASVWDGTELRLYVDGRRCGEVYPSGAHARPDQQFTQLAGPPLTDDPNAMREGQFDGILDEVRISNTARYTDDFTPEVRFTADEHTLALYHFDEGQGETLRDSSGNGHDGTIHGATWVREVAPGTWAPVDADRRAIEWAFAMGMRVDDHINHLSFESPDAVPADALWAIEVTNGVNLTDADLARLSGCTRLGALRLEGPNITDEGLRHLLTLGNLETLDLWNCDPVTGSGLEIIAGIASLYQLRLHGGRLSDDDLAHLGNFAHLQSLHIKDIPLSERGAQHLSQLPELYQLSLDGSQLTRPALAEVASISRLYYLDLSRTNVTDEDMALLADMPELTGLHLIATTITDAGLAHFAGNTKLTGVCLIGTQITDVGVETLATMPNLRIVQLQSNPRLTAAAVAKLHEAIPTSIIESDVFNFAPGQHLDRDAIVWAFSVGATVMRFDEHGSQIPVTSPDEIATDGAWSINLSETPNWTSADLARLSNCRRLLGVNLLLTPVTDEGLAHLAGLDQLQYLHLERCEAITDAGIAQLYGLHELVQLNLQYTAASGDAIAWAARNPNLQGFYIGPTDVDDLSPLASLPRLTFLTINANSPLTQSQVEQVAGMPQLTQLTLSPGVTDEGLAHLGRLTQLDHLFLIGANISGEGLSHLAGLERLHALSLKNNLHPTLRLDGLPTFGTLAYLELTNCAISDDDLDAIVRQPILDGLLLWGAPVTNAGVERLRNHSKLAVLDLRSCAVTDDCIDALSTIATLREIWIENTQLTADGIARLHEALPGCRIIADGGTIEPTASLVTNYALEFDGVDDFVTLPSVLSEVETFTIEVTGMLPELLPDGRGLISAGPLSLVANDPEHGGNWVAVFETPANRWIGVGGDATQAAGQPAHLALVFDGTQLEAFVDGQSSSRLVLSDATETAASLLARIQQGELTIGRQLNGDRQVFWDGVIDEVRISSVARYTENYTPQDRFETDEHTLALYHFDESEGDILHDASGNGHDGTINGATWVKEVAPGTWTPYDVDRAVAEWILAKGGRVKLLIDGGVSTDWVETLPNEPFHLLGAAMSDRSVTDGDLARFHGLQEFSQLLLDVYEGETNLTDAGLRNLGELPQLSILFLQGQSITDDGVRELSRFPMLHNISLANTDVTDAGLRHLSALAELGTLNLGATRIEGTGLAQLADCVRLSQLILSPTQINDAGMLALPAWPALQDLRLDGRQITDRGLEALSRFPTLQLLWIPSAQSITPDGWSVLTDLESLDDLYVPGSSITDEVLAQIATLPNLRSLNLAETNITDDGLKHLESASRLQHLWINGTATSDAGRDQLHAALPNCRIEWEGGVIEPVAGAVVGSVALEFDDFGEYVELPVHYDGTTPITVEMWWSTTREELVPDTVGSLFTVGPLRAKLTHSGELESVIYDFQDERGLPSELCELPIGETHLAVQWSGSVFTMFVDGQEVSRLPAADQAAQLAAELFARHAGDPMRLGMLHVPERAPEWRDQFFGRISELRISKTIRYSEEFTPVDRFETDEHTLALYHFDDGAGETLFDSSGNDRHGTIVGATWVGELSPGIWGPQHPDREAIVWALNSGLLVQWYFAAGNHSPIKSVDDLPADALWCIDLANMSESSDRALERLSGCTLIGQVRATNSDVSDVGISHLAGFRNLEVLVLSGSTNVTDAGIQSLAELRALRHVLVEGSAVTPNAAILVAADNWPNLEVLSTGSGECSPEVLERLVDLPRLYSFGVLDDSQFGDAHLGVLSNFSQLTHLSFRAPAVTDEGLGHVTRLSGLKALYLFEARGITAEGVAQISSLTNLKLLDASNSSLTDAGLASLSTLSELESLTLHGTQVTDAGMDVLREMPSLQTLGLSSLAITDVGLESLHSHGGLRTVYLHSTDVTSDGVNALHAALPNCRIEWDGGVIEPVPADRQAAEWIIGRRGNVLVRSGEQEIFCQTLEELPDAPFELIECSLFGWVPMDGWLPKIPPSEFSCLVGCRHLNQVQLENEIIGDEGLAYLAEIPSIERLYLPGNPGITDAGLAHIAKLSNLQLLVLADCSVTDAGLEQLTTLSNLEAIHLYGLPITDAGVANLKPLSGLTVLTMNGTQVTDAGLTHLSAFPALRVLDISGTEVTDAGIVHLETNASLTHLGVADTRVTDQCIDSVLTHPALLYLNVEGTKLSREGIVRLRSALPDYVGLLYDADRLLAEWMLSLGSEMAVRVGDSDSENEQTVASLDQLPAEPFIIRSLDVGSLAPVSGDELRMLSDLHDMVELDLLGAQVTADDISALHAALPGCRIKWDGGVIEPVADPMEAAAVE